jgi:hypothetical protein
MDRTAKAMVGFHRSCQYRRHQRRKAECPFSGHDAPGNSTPIVLYPPAADPGVTDDERRTIAEVMAKGTYASISLATADLDGTSSRCRPATPRSSRSRPSSRTGFATAPSAIARVT